MREVLFSRDDIISIKISINMDILLIEFYENIGEYFYKNIGSIKIFLILIT